MSRWNDLAAAAILQALKESSHLPGPQRLKMVDAAYPFGQRAYHPYKQWLKVRRQILVAHGLIPADHRVSKVRFREPAAPLFDPTVGPPAPIEAAPLVKCNTCAHHTARGGCGHPSQDWNRESDPDAQGRPWCHSGRS